MELLRTLVTVFLSVLWVGLPFAAWSSCLWSASKWSCKQNHGMYVVSMMGATACFLWFVASILSLIFPPSFLL